MRQTYQLQLQDGFSLNFNTSQSPKPDWQDCYGNITAWWVHWCKTHSARCLKKTWLDLLGEHGYNLRKCNHCGNRYVKPNRYIYDFDGNIVYLRSVEYDGEYYYCSAKECPGHKLNPNSVEFVAKTYNLSEEAALEYIHKRNSTPFYRENHGSEDDYIKYQTRDQNWYAERGKNMADSVARGNWKRSLDGKWAMFGDIGVQQYFETCRNKSLLNPSVIAKHIGTTDENAILEYQINFLTTQCSHGKLDREIFYDITKLVQYCINRFPLKYKNHPEALKEIDLIKLPCFHRNGKSIEIACKNLRITPEILRDDYIIPQLIDICDAFPNTNVKLLTKTMFSYMYVTAEGQLLRSSFEKDFYLEMCRVGLNHTNYTTDMIYPNQSGTMYRYDFHFQEIDTYIEIAGFGLDNEQYAAKIKKKIELFNPLIVYTHGDIKKIIAIVQSRYNELKSSTNIEAMEACFD